MRLSIKTAIESSFMVPVVTFGYRKELIIIIVVRAVGSLFMLSNTSAIMVGR